MEGYRRGRGEKYEMPTHLIESSKLSCAQLHALLKIELMSENLNHMVWCASKAKRCGKVWPSFAAFMLQHVTWQYSDNSFIITVVSSQTNYIRTT